jgi:hypothetical protein
VLIPCRYRLVAGFAWAFFCLIACGCGSRSTVTPSTTAVERRTRIIVGTPGAAMAPKLSSEKGGGQ